MTEPTRSGIAIDESMWPMLVITLPAYATDDDWSAMFASYDRLYRRRERFHIVNDGTKVRSVPTPAQRKVITDNTKRHEAESRRWILGSAVAVTSPLARGVLTALAWVSPPVYKLTYHARVVECVDETLATFAAQGVPVTEAMRSYRALRARDAA